MSHNTHKKLNSSDLMMQEIINFGGCLFTRFHLLKELQSRGFSVQNIDLHVFGPGLAQDFYRAYAQKNEE